MTDYSKFEIWAPAWADYPPYLQCNDCREPGSLGSIMYIDEDQCSIPDAMRLADEHWREHHAPQLTPNDPEPPVGTHITDANGDEWEHVAAVAGGSYWLQAHTHYAEPESWAGVVENYGPVKVVWP